MLDLMYIHSTYVCAVLLYNRSRMIYNSKTKPSKKYLQTVVDYEIACEELVNKPGSQDFAGLLAANRYPVIAEIDGRRRRW